MVSLLNYFTFFCFQFWRNKAAAIFQIILFSFPVMYQTNLNLYEYNTRSTHSEFRSLLGLAYGSLY